MKIFIIALSKKDVHYRNIKFKYFLTILIYEFSYFSISIKLDLINNLILKFNGGDMESSQL